MFRHISLITIIISINLGISCISLRISSPWIIGTVMAIRFILILHHSNFPRFITFLKIPSKPLRSFFAIIIPIKIKTHKLTYNEYI